MRHTFLCRCKGIGHALRARSRSRATTGHRRKEHRLFWSGPIFCCIENGRKGKRSGFILAAAGSAVGLGRLHKTCLIYSVSLWLLIEPKIPQEPGGLFVRASSRRTRRSSPSRRHPLTPRAAIIYVRGPVPVSPSHPDRLPDDVPCVHRQRGLLGSSWPCCVKFMCWLSVFDTLWRSSRVWRSGALCRAAASPDQTTAVYLAEPVADVIAVTCTAILFATQFRKALFTRLAELEASDRRRLVHRRGTDDSKFETTLSKL